MLNWTMNKLITLSERNLKDEPDYMENDFWIHKNGILKGTILHAIWKRTDIGHIKITCYGRFPEKAPPLYFNTLGEAITYLEKL